MDLLYAIQNLFRGIRFYVALQDDAVKTNSFLLTNESFVKKVEKEGPRKPLIEVLDSESDVEDDGESAYDDKEDDPIWKLAATIGSTV